MYSVNKQLYVYSYIYIYIPEIKARQRRAKRNMYFMFVASQMKTGHQGFSRKCNNS